MRAEPFSIIFIGTDEISLHGLNQLIKSPECKVTAVITQSARLKNRGMHSTPSLVAQKAKELSLPILTPDNLESPEFLFQVKKLKSQWVVLLSYGKILPPVFLDLFPKKALNFHASLLPRWRGAAPIQRAIMAGDEKMGMSLQIMEPRLDTGPLIGSYSFQMNLDMDAADVYNKTGFLIQQLLTDLFKYMNNQSTPILQDNSQSTYAHKIDKKEARIIWNQAAIQILNQIRSLVKGPQAYFLYNNKRVKIFKAQLHSEPASAVITGSTIEKKNISGQIISIASDYFTVVCADQNHLLNITKVQPESKKIMSAKEYIQGYNLKIGSLVE